MSGDRLAVGPGLVEATVAVLEGVRVKVILLHKVTWKRGHKGHQTSGQIAEGTKVTRRLDR